MGHFSNYILDALYDVPVGSIHFLCLCLCLFMEAKSAHADDPVVLIFIPNKLQLLLLEM